MNGSPDRFNDRRNILALAFECIIVGIAAVAAPPLRRQHGQKHLPGEKGCPYRLYRLQPGFLRKYCYVYIKK
jgi:hypothetical protein